MLDSINTIEHHVQEPEPASMPGIRPLDRPPPGVVDLDKSPLGRDPPFASELRQQVPGDLRIVSGIKIDPNALGQEEPEPGQTLHGRPQQRGIVAIRTRQNNSDRQAVAFDEHGPFLSGLATIGRVRSGVVTTAGSLHTAAINAQVSQVQADDLIEGLEHDLLQASEHTVGDPFIAAASQRCS
ncbi:hypothetical protein BKA07_003073 [Brevibacterium marinum]|uniref:Uncharacterized protein n=1 Tax=Brevibacterium marinum TaxID=418643 RepID=A0A846S8Z3_9MICO|nr:hypothetical protein [Brevibacterium marinum]NJC57267.1 hypothetical protein [Brevibacterium marinum]NJC58038.1 hypothetical protein [Brevibacterium marinum]